MSDFSDIRVPSYGSVSDFRGEGRTHRNIWGAQLAALPWLKSPTERFASSSHFSIIVLRVRTIFYMTPFLCEGASVPCADCHFGEHQTRSSVTEARIGRRSSLSHCAHTIVSSKVCVLSDSCYACAYYRDRSAGTFHIIAA